MVDLLLPTEKNLRKWSAGYELTPQTFINMILTSHFKSSAFVSILNALSELMPAQSCPSIFNIWSPNRIPTSAAGESTETKQQNIPASIDFNFNPNFFDWSRQIVTIRTPCNWLSGTIWQQRIRGT